MISEGGWDTLMEYVLDTAQQRPELLSYRPKAATIESLVKEDALVLDTLPQARLSVLLAEAFLAMSEDIHEPGDRAVISSTPLTPARAVVLKKEHGGIRAAARATGINYQKLWRAVREAEQEGVGSGE